MNEYVDVILLDFEFYKFVFLYRYGEQLHIPYESNLDTSRFMYCVNEISPSNFVFQKKLIDTL